MNRSQSLVFRLVIAAFAVAFLGSVTARLQAQTPPASAAKAPPAAEDGAAQHLLSVVISVIHCRRQ